MEPETLREKAGSFCWLVADAGLAAILAGAAETLLLFLLSPERPLTLGDFVATLLALAPHILVVFVLGGPALVLLGRLLSVARATQRGISVRYVLRFALLDAILLSVTALFQWRRFESVVPEPGRTALALMTTALVLTAATLLLILLRDLWRPLVNLVPWLAATAVGLLVTLGIAAELRRVRVPVPEPVSLPGFSPSVPIVMIEIPGLDARLARDARRRGETPFLAELSRSGTTAVVRPGTVGDSLSLHATLVTGQEPSRHGLLRAVRYQPLGDRRSFSVLPYGLLLRPLVNTPLWRRIPVDHRVLRSVALPGIFVALSGGPGAPASDEEPSLALVGDPLGWPLWRPGWLVVSESQVSASATIATPGGAIDCSAPVASAERFFDPPSGALEGLSADAALLEEALSADSCALRVAAAAAEAGVDFVHVRLPGFPRVAERFAGFSTGFQARGVSDREIAAYGRTLRRYLRELDPLLRAAARIEDRAAIVVVVSPHAVTPREDFGRVLYQIVGLRETTATFSVPRAGFFQIAGPGIARARKGRVSELELAAVLPTLLAATGLPVADDMAPPVERLLEGPGPDGLGPVSLPGYAVARR